MPSSYSLGDTLPVMLDTCVLFPATLRDTLLRAAEYGLYRVHWSEEILEELRANLISEIHLDESVAHELTNTLRTYFPEAAVRGYESLIPVMRNHRKDRHVLAAAVRIGAQVIVTENIKDFPQEALDPFAIEAETPDAFLTDLFHRYPDNLVQLVREQTAELRNPPQSLTETLHKLARHAPTFVGIVRHHIHP